MEIINEFPKWKPLRYTIKRFKNNVYEVRYQALKNSSSSFIKRLDVRNYIFKKFNNQCTNCGSIENLTIDHIVSIYRVAKNKLDFEFLNSEENLTVLCKSCNSTKTPD